MPQQGPAEVYNCAHLKNKTKEEGRFLSSYDSAMHTGTREQEGAEKVLSLTQVCNLLFIIKNR